MLWNRVVARFDVKDQEADDSDQDEDEVNGNDEEDSEDGEGEDGNLIITLLSLTIGFYFDLFS